MIQRTYFSLQWLAQDFLRFKFQLRISLLGAFMACFAFFKASASSPAPPLPNAESGTIIGMAEPIAAKKGEESKVDPEKAEKGKEARRFEHGVSMQKLKGGSQMAWQVLVIIVSFQKIACSITMHCAATVDLVRSCNDVDVVGLGEYTAWRNLNVMWPGWSWRHCKSLSDPRATRAQISHNFLRWTFLILALKNMGRAGWLRFWFVGF